jgi:hypothetical protein
LLLVSGANVFLRTVSQNKTIDYLKQEVERKMIYTNYAYKCVQCLGSYGSSIRLALVTDSQKYITMLGVVTPIYK